MRLENEKLLVEISENGAELTRIYHKEKQEELLWNADPTYWKRHAPVLFPVVGKVYSGKTLINGKEYAFSQHGFARDMVFETVKHSETEAILVLRANEETMEKYPFRFELEIGYVLREGTVTVRWKVTNHSEDRMPFTIGAHPAFALDSCKGKKEDFCLEFPGKTQLNYVLLDPASGCAVPETVYTLPLEEGYLKLNEEMFAKDALVADGGQIEEAWLCTGNRERLIGLKSPGFPNYGIWSAKGASFVCLEPWEGRTDNVGYRGELADKPGATVLEANGVFEKSYDIVTE